MKIRENYTCPLEIVHDIMKGKWKTILLFQLSEGGRSLSQLEHGINGISQKMLLQQLRELREYGLVEKHTFPGYPLRVEYTLTAGRGAKMMEAVRIMQEIGAGYLEEHRADASDPPGKTAPTKK